MKEGEQVRKGKNFGGKVDVRRHILLPRREDVDRIWTTCRSNTRDRRRKSLKAAKIEGHLGDKGEKSSPTNLMPPIEESKFATEEGKGHNIRVAQRTLLQKSWGWSKPA